MKKTILITLVTILGLAAGIANADYVFGTPENLGPTINTSGNDITPYISPDELSLYFTSDRPGGYGGMDIYMSTRATKEDPWSEAVNPGPPINTPAWDWYPCLSPDGCTLYFGSSQGMVDSAGGMFDIWVSTRPTINDPWCEPSNLGPNINSSSKLDRAPAISCDGLELYFVSVSRSGGLGGPDIWMATRETQDSEWGPAVNLGPPVNTGYEELGPRLSADGLLLFFSSGLTSTARPGGMGHSDIWMARRPSRDAAWGKPVNLGQPVNSWEDEGGAHLSADGRTLYYTVGGSPLGGPKGDLYQVSIDPIVDLNDDGIVDALDMCIIVDHWGTDNSLCDIGPTPFGDGIVDVQDLIVLAEHLFEEVP